MFRARLDSVAPFNAVALLRTIPRSQRQIPILRNRSHPTIFIPCFRSENSWRNMMAGKLLATCLRGVRTMQIARMSGEAPSHSFTRKIGNREVVGWGVNGEAAYHDHEAWPMPAIRFKEITPDLAILKEKEKGDWKKLTLEEKKTLYRASFCQTFAEMVAPTGEWKSILGVVLMLVSTGLWLFVGVKVFVNEPLPPSFSEESRLAQLERMLVMEVNPITGISSRK